MIYLRALISWAIQYTPVYLMGMMLGGDKPVSLPAMVRAERMIGARPLPDISREHAERILSRAPASPIRYTNRIDAKGRLIPKIQPPPFEAGHGRPDLDMLHHVVFMIDRGDTVDEVRDTVAAYLTSRPDDRKTSAGA